jgi:transcriptional regulator
MYVPAHFTADDATVRAVLDRSGAGDLVTVGEDGLLASLIPFVHDPGAGGQGSLLGHLARNNPQWRASTTDQALVILRGPDGYVSPGWYATKTEHGRVVPTWDYLTVHVHGRLVVHDDPEFVADVVHRLTEQHEAGRAVPWSVEDAPPAYVAGQLRAVVGVEVRITRIEAKAKLSQNRPAADVDGVLAGLLGDGRPDLADAVARATGRPRPAGRDPFR